MNYFLAKTDPKTYSIDDLEKEKVTLWDGVHSYEAINVINSMKPGDLVFIYHSQGEACIVGLAKVTTSPRQNPKDPRKSSVVDMQFVKRFNAPITLKEIKESNKFNDWKLVKQSRLSTMHVPLEFIQWTKVKGYKIIDK